MLVASQVRLHRFPDATPHLFDGRDAAHTDGEATRFILAASDGEQNFRVIAAALCADHSNHCEAGVDLLGEGVDSSREEIERQSRPAYGTSTRGASAFMTGRTVCGIPSPAFI
jgi:hypothetical protein